MGRRGAAATANDADAVLLDELGQRLGKRFWLQRVDGNAVHVERQAGVGDARNRQAGLFTQNTNRFAHVLGAGGTVQADDVNGQAFEDGQRSGDIGAEQHPPARIQRDLGLDRQPDAGFLISFLDAGDGGLDFQDVLRGFDQQQVHAAADQTGSLFAKNVGQLVEADIGEFGIVGGG